MKDFFVYNSLGIYSLLILILIYYQAKLNLKNKDSKFNRLWSRGIIIAVIIQFMDIISWLYQSFPSVSTLVFSYISNTLVFIFLSFFTINMAMFIEYSLEYSKKAMSFLRKMYFPIGIINTLFTILSIPFGFYFSYKNGIYIRGELNFVFNILCFLPLIIMVLRILFKYKGSPKLKTLILLGLFVPVLAAFVHLLEIISVPILFPATTLLVVIMNSLLINNSLCLDFLTGLQNNRGIDRYFSNLPPVINGYIGAIFIDINGFKAINDLYGHAEGDNALSALARILGSSARGNDLVARMGGDEFLIVSVMSAERDINIIMMKINDSLDRYNRLSSKPYKLEISYGFYINMPNVAIDKGKIISEADRRMYIQKNIKNMQYSVSSGDYGE